MCYAHSPAPRNAPNVIERRPRSATMNARRYRSPAPSPRILAALAALEITCNCKCSLIVSCAVGAEPGCRERRHEGICGCRPRWLPVCILDAATPHGCPVWREGKTCSCERLYMPRCLVTGCEDRRKGQRCECPRTPTETCPHVLEKIEQFADLTPEAAERYAEAWHRLQRKFLPEKYAEPPLPDAGGNVSTRDAAIALMQLRFDAARALRHQDDWGLKNKRRVREERERERCTKAIANGFLALLHAVKDARKGAKHGEAA